MYTEFFGLNEKPFSITPDPRYLYMSRRHADALAHLIYGVSESGGFIQLTGEVGTGKTTLIRSLLEQLPERAEIALILNPQLTTREFLQSICEELRTAPPADGTIKALIDSLNAQLLRFHAEGRRVVLIVDEAQTLSPELLEQVRLLTNLETAKQKLLQIILIGQPELREILQRPEMRQIAQRVTGRYHLEPLSRDDIAAYVRHRLRVAGAQRDIFTPRALGALYRLSAGIPRLINVIADRALLAAYTEDRTTVDAGLVRRAANEVFGRRRPAGPLWPYVAVAVGIASFALATTNLFQRASAPEETQPAPTVAARPAAPAGAQRDAEVLGLAPVAHERTATTPADAPPAGPAFSRLEDLFASGVLATDPDAAIGELLSVWGASYDPARGRPCEQAQRQGLRCLFQEHGSIAELRRIDRPAVLSLSDGGGRREVVITSLGYDTAELRANGRSYTVQIADLAQYWYGDHLLLWRPAGASGGELRPGMSGEGVRWLRETLARIRGEPVPETASSFYDAELEARVRAYQRERQLAVDGIVGARTLIALSSDLGDDSAPSLVRRH